MPRNIEIKVRCDDHAPIRDDARRLGATFSARVEQADTFFECARGRLKLREFADGTAELIAYARDDAAEGRASDYAIARVGNGGAMLDALSRALATGVTVRKVRELWMWRDVRIHLDAVEGLGTFVELESVVGIPGEAAARADYQTVFEALRLGEREAIDVAYADLLARG